MEKVKPFVRDELLGPLERWFFGRSLLWPVVVDYRVRDRVLTGIGLGFITYTCKADWRQGPGRRAGDCRPCDFVRGKIHGDR